MDYKDIGYFIKNIDEKLKKRADEDLKDHHLTLSQSVVITYLLEREDGLATQKEIEDRLNVSHPAVVGIVSRLEQNHHVTTWMDPQDRRNKMVQLTSQARTMGESMARLRAKWEKTMLSGFSPEEAKMLKGMLQRVNDNLSSD
ncbi:MAG: MarR family winged helix-turn-helix transcriptional regulator [Lachnospiraceae bacterium]